MTKWTLSVLLSVCWTLPLSAQVPPPSKKIPLENKLTQMIQRRVATVYIFPADTLPTKPSTEVQPYTPPEILTEEELIEAEMKLQHALDTQDFSLTFSTNPQLLQEEDEEITSSPAAANPTLQQPSQTKPPTTTPSGL